MLICKPLAHTLREAAVILRLNPRALREYLKRREIKGRIIGGSWATEPVNAGRVEALRAGLLPHRPRGLEDGTADGPKCQRKSEE
jgi:hypothetical protein